MICLLFVAIVGLFILSFYYFFTLRYTAAIQEVKYFVDIMVITMDVVAFCALLVLALEIGHMIPHPLFGSPTPLFLQWTS